MSKEVNNILLNPIQFPSFSFYRRGCGNSGTYHFVARLRGCVQPPLDANSSSSKNSSERHLGAYSTMLTVQGQYIPYSIP
jgi:hypothetical protein